MKRAKIRLPNEKWGSTVSKYPANSKQVPADAFTSGSKNFDTDVRGIITKRKGDVEYNADALDGTLKDLYEAVFVDGSRHLLAVAGGKLSYSSGSGSFTEVSDDYTSGANFEFATYADRVYFGNGVDNPQVYDRTASYGGVSSTAPAVKDMGCQAPGSALSGAAGSSGNVPDGNYLYKVTFLYYDAEESNGGSASSTVTVSSGPKQVDLTAIPTGGYGVTARKIYRSDDDGSTYRLVKTISDNTATTATDDEAIGTSLIPEDSTAPRNFSLIVQNKDRMWIAGFAGDKSSLDFSDAGFPDIYPVDFTILCNSRDPITGLAVFNDRVVVFNRNSFGQILGTTADTFRYSEVPGNIGCVDNRTIQIRTIHGVPIIMWLSDRGFYAFNGSTVEYISDDIEDLVNFNIQQANQSTGSISQSNDADFNAGTSSPSIVIAGGTVSTIDPVSLWETRAQWEGGSTVAGSVTRLPAFPASLGMAAQSTLARASGVNSGTTTADGNIKLPEGTAFTGESYTGTALADNSTGLSGSSTESQSTIVPTRSGTLTGVRPASSTYTLFGFTGSVRVYSDSFGQPGTLLYTGPSTTVTSPTLLPASFALTGGTTYWIGVVISSGNFAAQRQLYASGGAQKLRYDSNPWTTPTYTEFENSSTNTGYTFTQTPVPASGTWTSGIYDSGLYPVAASLDVVLNHTGSFPAGTTGTSFVDQSDNSGMSSPTSMSTGNLNGNHTFTFAATKRYWQVRVQLTTTDDTVTPSVTSDPSLTFPSTLTWISETVDSTTDIDNLDELSVTLVNLPAGTTATAYVQKSTTSSSGFADSSPQTLVLGSNVFDMSGITHSNYRYSRVKIVLDNTSAPASSPFVAFASLTWQVSAFFESSHIDTGATPAGWNIFQASSTGDATFQMKSGALEGDLAGNNYFNVSNGAFPSAVDVNRWAQWSVTLVGTHASVPVVDSVTINWFISAINSLRAASIFYNKTYYVSLAERNQTANNVILLFDELGNWRIYREMEAGTFSMFFNEPYYGDATEGTVRKFLSGTNDHGDDIDLEIRTKAFDFDDATKRKAIRQVSVLFGNTGAEYSASYSVDNGTTWQDLQDAAGNTQFTLLNNSDLTNKRLVPVWPAEIQGRTIMVKITESSSAEAAIHQISVDAVIREGEIIDG